MNPAGHEATPGAWPVLTSPDAATTVAVVPHAVAARLPVRGCDLRSALQLSATRRAEHLAGRALLRWLLAEVAGSAVAAAVIARRPGGQPYLPDRDRVAVSVSHTDGWIAAATAVDGRPVGVDTQVPLAVGAGMLRRCCGPAAAAELAHWDELRRHVEFAWVWTTQEACVKAAGSGLRGLPWQVPVAVSQRAGTWRGLRWVQLRDLAQVPVPVSCAVGEAA